MDDINTQKQIIFENENKLANIIILIPNFFILIIFNIFKDGLLCLFLLQIYYITFPYAYNKYILKQNSLKAFFLSEFENRIQQIKYGITFGAVMFILLLLYYIFLYEFKHNMLQHLNLPIQFSALYLFTFLIIFQFINPILEEWFWRIFLEKYLGQKNINIIHIGYTLFHLVALLQIMSLQLAFFFATSFFSLSRTFSYVKNNKGIISCIIGHIFLSFFCGFAILDVLYIEWDHQNNIIHQEQ
ncbi:hypothetical protein IMG5_107570 [Ichthyophthirius multifiliis]|uniref:CAAX prenyl protease 2/Lysostaphin resistance protein A-like domain-containing protein n=1 Tax=Ichthyophthirius multifiliis TaxID=5932 RepID=G0QTA2_ICHMU|nr:hypothetical protein IMG5_107570 [Ichthyophthirius multifiliis]EGR31537.1 hypothetical protein IMG5_107570 [Ichthyophthirius multifiliis]|eukprot:XP_004035023.1 hypothetical protein IMG5_107570 [Ichthyophthirius multifiliis]